MEITGAKNGSSTSIVSNMMAIVMRRATRFQFKPKERVTIAIKIFNKIKDKGRGSRRI